MPSRITLFYGAAPAGAPTPVQIPGTTPDVKALNYALALETLEAELYRQALARLTGGGTDFYGKTITGLGLTGADVDYLTTFGKVEAEHRDFLTTALGGNWVTTAGAGFDFGFAEGNLLEVTPLTRAQTVQLVYAAEQTGISAYLGGITAGGLVAGSQYLATAASILGTEARHTTAVAILLNSPLFNQTPKLASAPLATDPGVLPTAFGTDTPLGPDAILNTGGLVAKDTTVAGDGKINAISGAAGFVFAGAATM